MADLSGPIDRAHDQIGEVKRLVTQRLFGVEDTVESLFIALIAQGHILLEDVPGVGKTELAKVFARALGLSFHRIQCTPDLLPADVVGGLVYHPQTSEFTVRRGPIFAHLVLVDEINRALPRTQSALLEAMAENQVTIDGESYRLPQPFMIIATQNPVESQGVFPLPEAQLDRFLLKTSLGYPSADQDRQILSLHLKSDQIRDDSDDASSAPPDHSVDSPDQTAVFQAAAAAVRMSPDVLEYISAIVRATRTHPDVVVGASPRAMILLAKAARALAVTAGRDYVTPDDVQRLAAPVLFHRLVLLGPDDDVGVGADIWMKQLLTAVEVPIEGAVL